MPIFGIVPDGMRGGVHVYKMAESVVKCNYKGTEYSFVTKDPAQIQDLKCPICLELVYEPVLTTCGHLFCQKCVRGLARCPTCRDELEFIRNHRDERRVKGLKVKCHNWEKGCKWQGDLGGIAQHMGTDCQMEIIPCPQGCAEEIARGRLKKHALICTFRAHKCPHCWFKGTFINVTTTHFTTCDNFHLKCPAECRRQLSRFNMAEHLAGCAEELVPCKYASLGCEEVMKRKSLQTHLQNMKDYHLEKAMDRVMQHSMVLSEVLTTVRTMTAEGAKHDTSHLPLSFCPWLQNTPTCYPRPPWVIKMEGFQEKKEKDEEWFCDPVYSHFGGYKMCLKVHTNGDRDAQGTLVSVYICLMRGNNDSNLKWPFKGTIKVSLLNQLEDRQHHTRQIWSPDENVPEEYSCRVTRGERAGKGWGLSKFISHRDLDYRSDKNCKYLKDNTLFFRVDCFEPKLD